MNKLKVLVATACATLSLTNSVSQQSYSYLITKNNPLLMVIGSDSITKGEFEYMYTKNNQTSIEGALSPKDYLDLFVNYKLKAQDAIAQLGKSRSGTYYKEMEAFQHQCVLPRLMNTEIESHFVKEAYERSKEKISASHILINGEGPASKKKIDDIYKKLLAGAPFDSLARVYSDCPSSSRGGYLGYFSAFEMVYNFETVAYNTPVGKYSEPFRTPFGWHIIWVSDRQPNVHKVKAQEIFISRMTGRHNITGIADSIVELAKKGKNFEKLALKNSDRLDIKQNKGNIGWITREAGFDEETVNFTKTLSKVGQIEQYSDAPGIHIFKVVEILNADPLDSLEYDRLKNKILKTDRYRAVSKMAESEFLARHGFAINEEMLTAMAALDKGDEIDLSDYFSHYDLPVYELEGDKYMYEDVRTDYQKYKGIYGRVVYQDFVITDKDIVVDTTITYKENLRRLITNIAFKQALVKEMDLFRKEDKEYAYREKEYSDGLMVYFQSDQMVWNQWSNSEDSLNKFFQRTKDQYTLDTVMFVGGLFEFHDKAHFDKVSNYIKKHNPSFVGFSQIIKDSLGLVAGDFRVKDGAWRKGRNATIDELVYGIKDTTTKENNYYPYPLVIGEQTNKPQQMKTVRGKVVLAHQEFLEKKWIKSIRERYPVKIFDDVFATIKDQTKKK